MNPLRLVLVSLLGVLTAAAAPKALPAGQLPDDARLKPPKDLDGYFPFDPPASAAAWTKRAEQVRRRILVSQGLWPMPTRTPLNAVIWGRIDQGEYTIDKVYFESAPGFFVTGNLYRPKQISGKAPGVLFAHGHWTDARLSEATPAELRRELANGEERFEDGGRSRFQSLCVQLARMGCVVWQWDMLGNSDAQQISMAVAHNFAKQRPEMNTLENWGLFSPQAEAHLQSVMGLQTWNAIRSLDFLLSLPEVDPDRIAVTGASGGGTQTFILAAVDDRVKLAFPAVMVSTAMQGGCTCENASLLRVGTGNVEIAGLFAPKPLGMTSANDWTKEMATKGLPQLKQLYALLGAPDAVMLQRGEHFPHNYNAVSRSAFYTWLNRHFKLGQTEPVVERDYPFLKRDALTVWDAQHPPPKSGDPDFERQLLRWFHDDAQTQLAQAARSNEAFRKTVGGAVEIVLGRTLSGVGEVTWRQTDKSDRGSWLEIVGTLRNSTQAEELPAVFAYPKQWNGTTVAWFTSEGKAGLFRADGKLRPDVQAVVDSGATVLGVDLLYQGEFLADGTLLTQTPKVKETREAPAYTFGYNPAVFAQRVHDILSVIQFVRTNERKSTRLALVGLDSTAPLVAAARALSSSEVTHAVIATRGFRFGQFKDYRAPEFLPGGAKYGDLPGLIALGAPGKVWVIGESADQLRIPKAQYELAGAANALSTPSTFDSAALIGWLKQ
ncbi:MAG TPA: acetylxylan esterase [Verrucomicrobiota bacterium]|nr:acetylxylan esterase [Verrucomicrobiota bacterium]